MTTYGIKSLSFYTSHYYLPLAALAAVHGKRADALARKLGQQEMAVPPPDEDIVTMGANAARQALDGLDPDRIGAVIFATETGIDQSKAAAIYVHELLDLPRHCQAYEIKQACCASSVALQQAVFLAQNRPDRQVLIIAADIARYGIGTIGEPTQGAAAAAAVVGAEPELVAIDPRCGSYTEDVMDFWRPNYRDEALVDGKLSVKMYLAALAGAYEDFKSNAGCEFEDFERFCYHMPFSRMAETAHHHFLHQIMGYNHERDAWLPQIEAGMVYNRRVGNSYTASLMIALASLLEQDPADLGGDDIGFFGYGSGCMGSFFRGTVTPGYQTHLRDDLHEELLAKREELSYDEYCKFYQDTLPTDGAAHRNARHHTGHFRLTGISEHQRQYARVEPLVEAPRNGKQNGAAVAHELAEHPVTA